jgi:hypothetical protein
MNAIDYLRARAKLDRNYRTKLKSLDELWSDLNDGKAPPAPIECHDDAVESVRGEWRLLARQEIEEMAPGTHFTVREMQGLIAKRKPLIQTDAPAVSTFLKHLADNKEIKVIEAGSGRRATIYSRNK